MVAPKIGWLNERVFGQPLAATMPTIENVIYQKLSTTSLPRSLRVEQETAQNAHIHQQKLLKQ
ncbi:MAG: hypothetical protein ACRC5D_20055 [Aeromonas allosaccharophila]